MTSPKAELVGTGSYLPERVMTNADFEAMLDTSDQWIRERTGIRERRVASDKETVAWMAKEATQSVMKDAGITADDIEVIILATASPDRYLPSTACDLQAELGAKNARAFDLGAACSGFIYGLTVAEGMIAAGQAENILVVGGERLTRIIDYTDRTTCILFGDGAGATLVRPADNGSERGILSSYLRSDGSLAELLYRPGGGGNMPPSQQLIDEHAYYIRMAGREVFKAAVRSMADACIQAIERAGLTPDDIDVLIPHQANVRIMEATAKRAGVSMDKVFVNVDRYGNTSAASIPIALDEAVRAGRVKEGSIVLMVAFGGGFTWASLVLRW